MVGSATNAERPTVGKCLCESFAKDKPPKLKDVPSPQHVSTTLCRQCGHTLKVKLRVRAVDNIEKIRSGHIPQSSEYDMIAQLIKEGEEDAERYRKEIDDLRSTTAKIEKDKQILETYLLDLRCMLSPIRRMPVEVLTEIFGQVCCTVNGDSENEVGGNDLRSRRPLDMPTLVLASVCSVWRKIVESTPSLWSHIVLSYNQTITPPRLLDFFLDRSDPVPLHFHLESVNHLETYATQPRTNNNVHKLLQHASRWASVSLGPMAHPFIGSQILQQLAYTDLPHLLRMDIKPDPEYVDFEDSLFIMEERTSPIPPRVPNLRSISLDSFYLSVSNPIASLRSLELTNIEPHRVMLTLEQLPNLTDLALHRCPVQDPAKSTPAFVVENLRNFFIDWDSFVPPLDDDIYPHEKVLNALTLPALESLTLVDVAYEGDGFSAKPLMEMFERSQALGMKLKKLRLWSLDINDVELIPMLRQGYMSDLTHLTVKERSYTETVTDEVVQALMRTSVVDENTEAMVVSDDVSEPAFLPCLTHLDLMVYPRFSSDEFLEMVMSRWYIYDSALTGSSISSGSSGHSGWAASSTSRPGPGLSRLTNLRLNRFTGALYDNLRNKLEELSEEGLKVSFNDPYLFPSWKAESATTSS